MKEVGSICEGSEVVADLRASSSRCCCRTCRGGEERKGGNKGKELPECLYMYVHIRSILSGKISKLYSVHVTTQNYINVTYMYM